MIIFITVAQSKPSPYGHVLLNNVTYETVNDSCYQISFETSNCETGLLPITAVPGGGKLNIYDISIFTNK